MARTPARFTNPITLATYDWAINHDEEDSGGRVSEVNFEVSSGSTALIASQGDLQPLVLKYSGKILAQSQLEEMLEWFALTRTQTIYYRDPAGDEYEGIISAFDPKRVRTGRNPRELGKSYYWTYTFEFSVVRVISGPWTAVPA